MAWYSAGMRRVLALSILAACGGSGDDAPTGPITATVTHYDYRFDIDSRLAHATVTAAVTGAGDCLTLPFRADGLDVGTVTVDGAAAASATVAGETLVVCGDGHREGDALELAVDVTIPERTLSTSQVGYSVRQDLAGNPFYYLVSWVGGCDQFGPCDNRPDQFATYTFHVSHPAAFAVRCPGAITEVSATETQCDFTHEGGPTYSTFGVAAYPAWVQTSKGSWGSVAVTVYDRPATRIEAAIDPAYHAGFVAFMESTFGAFPFGGELRVLTAPTYWSGFEHPGNIVLDDRLNQGQSSYLHPVAHVLDHEIAHQWAGDQTTLADTYDFVWKESMAEYLAYVYEDMVDVPAAAKTASAWKGFSSGARFFPVPDDKPELFDYYGDVYGPGPMILFRQLEVLTSRAQVIAAIQSVLGRPHALSVTELVAALETSTGLALTDYAAAWIHGTGAPEWPEIATVFTPGADTSTLRVTQANATNRTCKFHVALVGANPGEQTTIAVDTFRDGVDQTLTVPTPAYAVTRVDLDPLRECLVFPKASAVARPRATHPWAAGHLAPATDVTR
jgi:aminopeptidase N